MNQKSPGACDGLDNSHCVLVLLQNFSLLDVEFNIFLHALNSPGFQTVSPFLKDLPQSHALPVHGLANIMFINLFCYEPAAYGAAAEIT